MKKLLVFAIVLTFMSQASMSSAYVVNDWGGGGTSSLSNFVFSGTGEYKASAGNPATGDYRTDTVRAGWGNGGSLYATKFSPAQYVHVSGLTHVFQENPGASDLVSFDYNLAITFTKSAALNMSGTLHFDYLRTSDSGIFIVNTADMAAFNKTFVVDGILYESSLDIGILTGADLSLAQAHLGVGADVQLYGWAVTEAGISSHNNFNLDIVARGNAPVPVPGAVWLLGSGVAGIMAIKRRNSIK